MRKYIFGAKATAAGLYKAISVLEPEKRIEAFLVSSMESNPQEIWGHPVRLLQEVSQELSEEQKMEAQIYVAVPELIHEEIENLLRENGFSNLELIDSRKEADIMERYYRWMGAFASVHDLPLYDEENAGYRKDLKALSSDEDDGCLSGYHSNLPGLTVYAAAFYKDRPLKNPPQFPSYVKKLYLGCEGAQRAGIVLTGQADFYDNTGDNISEKNPNRCEMTAHYWVWRNRLDTEDEYVGICHYRRMLDLSNDDLRRIRQNDVDVVLPFPMVHYPDCAVQHTWYVPQEDWATMRSVLRELHPEYEERWEEIFHQPYFYNYNMLLAKKEVFADYCAWLYPVLDRIEELSEPKGVERADRYTAYLSESLTTLYFMCRREELKIVHTGRLLFT